MNGRRQRLSPSRDAIGPQETKIATAFRRGYYTTVLQRARARVEKNREIEAQHGPVRISFRTLNP